MKTPQQKASLRQEKAGAALHGGRRTPGSGNGWAVKNDVRTAKWSIEYKTTAKKSYTLKLDELLLAERHALLDGREMAFGIQMGHRSWVVLDENTFHQFTNHDRGN
ncbi:hypothetical protein [Actinomadura atramentaria]|uniref:hypothetical protein n=1 Tax=Actinomadura atramentaria TaxID=1990 RepID=UPI000361180D|nr:hypothetical protein [Actinomadura atramentaria]